MNEYFLMCCWKELGKISGALCRDEIKGEVLRHSAMGQRLKNGREVICAESTHHFAIWRRIADGRTLRQTAWRASQHPAEKPLQCAGDGILRLPLDSLSTRCARSRSLGVAQDSHSFVPRAGLPARLPDGSRAGGEPDKCRGWDSNPYALCRTQDFKSCASTNSATPANNCQFSICDCRFVPFDRSS